MSDKEKELLLLRQGENDKRQKRISQLANDRLKKISHIKFRTCFVSALAEFENTFGFELWGHNLPDDKITKEQKANKILWDKVRKNILDKGNAQSRALGMEIDLHKIEFQGYRINLGEIGNG